MKAGKQFFTACNLKTTCKHVCTSNRSAIMSAGTQLLTECKIFTTCEYMCTSNGSPTNIKSITFVGRAFHNI